MHKENVNDLYSPPGVIRVIKPRKMKQEGRLCHLRKRNTHRWTLNRYNWINLAQDNDNWPTVVNTVIKVWFP